jgi:transcription elongation factor GreA
MSIAQTPKVEITQAGFDNLKKELAKLVEVDRPANIARLQHARSMGDLRENSEYHASKEEQGLIEGRIFELEQLIELAQVIAVSKSTSIIQLGCEVEVEVKGNKDTYYIVGEYEADPMNKKLSQSSPIGKALIGKKVGESVDVDVPVGKMTFKVVDIKTR